jgi:D-glycero-alpha-D-manno-heptose-7-phosphate kinase
MIISRTPYRISFFGGGTDYPVWYLQHGGQVLATTIDKYVYISCRSLPPFFKHKLRVVYSRIELCTHADELEHPTARESLKYVGITAGLEIHYDGDLPGRSGMGSSSAFTVGLLNALYAYSGRKTSAIELARDSTYVEQQLVKETVGSQDQVAVACGGLNKICFGIDGGLKVENVNALRGTIDKLSKNLMLFYTGIERTASDIAMTYAGSLLEKEKVLKKMSRMVDAGVTLLCEGGDLDEFGELLHEAWIQKSLLSPMISNSTIDDIYSAAKRAGALGGKILGAGGGGMLLLYVPLDRQESVVQALSDLIHVSFDFETGGSQIIFQPE